MDSHDRKHKVAERDAKRTKSRADQEKRLEEGIEDTFPASDALSSVQPGGGITGPEVIRDKKRR